MCSVVTIHQPSLTDLPDIVLCECTFGRDEEKEGYGKPTVYMPHHASSFLGKEIGRTGSWAFRYFTDQMLTLLNIETYHRFPLSDENTSDHMGR